MAALTHDQIETVRNHLVALGADIRCRICSHSQHRIVGLYHIPMVRPNHTGTAMPSIALMCELCSHVEWFAAVPILGSNL